MHAQCEMYKLLLDQANSSIGAVTFVFVAEVNESIDNETMFVIAEHNNFPSSIC